MVKVPFSMYTFAMHTPKLVPKSGNKLEQIAMEKKTAYVESNGVKARNRSPQGAEPITSK